MPNRSRNRTAGFNLMRWLMVVALGGCLGVLLVTVLNFIRPAHREALAGEMVLSEPDWREFQVSEASVKKELQGVIDSQLSAFRRENYSQAYTYAARELRANLPLSAFEQMVRVGYPALAESRSAEFGPIIDNGKMALVNVTVSAKSGETRQYQYFLQREASGWKISAVKEVKPEATII